MTNIKQGEIYLADLNPTKGHEQAGYRPVLVLQNNILNKHLTTAIIVPLTTNVKAKGKMTTYFIDAKVSGLSQSSIALLFQIRTLDKKRLTKRIGLVDEAIIKDIKQQLQFVF